MPQNLPLQTEKKFETNKPEANPENVVLSGKTVEALNFPEKERTADSSQDKEKTELAGVGSEGEAVLVVGGSTNSTFYQERLKKIEATLEKDLSELYTALPNEKKQEFKKVGEETAQKINQMLSQASYKIQAIIALIKKWLSLLPGVNQFFIEQETKIKTDEIVRLKDF